MAAIKLVICCELAEPAKPAKSVQVSAVSEPELAADGEGDNMTAADKPLRVRHGDRYIPKERRSLVKQIEMSMAVNRRAGGPFDMHITSW